MGWFNAQAFAAGALGELEKGMTRREDEARKYEDEQRELAKESRSEIMRRRSVVSSLVSEAKRLESLGVSKAQIQAAHSSGPSGLMELSKQVQAEVKRRGGKARLSEYDISAMIDSTAIAPKYAEMDYEEFIASSAGLSETKVGDLKAPEQSILQKFLGAGAKDRVRAKLDKEETVGGMSIYDINELARGQAYQSVIPGAYATFTPGEFYDEEAALKSWSLAKRRIDISLGEDPQYAKLLAQTDQSAAVAYKRNKYSAFAQAQFNKYGKAAINDPVVDWKDLLGDEIFTNLTLANGGEEDVAKKINTLVAASGNGKTINMSISGGGSFSITTGLGEKAAQVTLTGPNGEKVITDPKMIDEFLDGLVAKGLMSQDAVNRMKNTSSDDDMGLPTDPVIGNEAVSLSDDDMGLPDTPVNKSYLEHIKNRGKDVQLEVGDASDEFKVNGFTYEQWQNMDRAERRKRDLPVSVIGGEIGFKRFQKGLGMKLTEDVPEDIFENMGEAMLARKDVDVGTLVRIEGEDYTVGETLNQKYFEKIDDKSLPNEDGLDITKKAIKEFLTLFKSGPYDVTSEDDLYAAFADYISSSDLPREVEQNIADRLEMVAESLAGN
tara:strand:+ start:551 stop:2374 length:1824 start_codon:yes stop_codon:yes gene_type:complete